jgi:hypothetical protein
MCSKSDLVRFAAWHRTRWELGVASHIARHAVLALSHPKEEADQEQSGHSSGFIVSAGVDPNE